MPALLGLPLNNSGSSPGLGGGIGNVQSISGSSFFTLPTPPSAAATTSAGALDLDLLDLAAGATGGLIVTSLGGVNTSVGGSYGGMGVALLLLLLRALPDPEPDPMTER
jgi:hypothetical protein